MLLTWCTPTESQKMCETMEKDQNTIFVSFKRQGDVSGYFGSVASCHKYLLQLFGSQIVCSRSRFDG